VEEMSEIYDRLRGVETKQSTHEAVCAERYAGIMQITTEMKSDFKSLNKQLVALGVLIISGMAGILVNLLLK
jgi:hypothetical protein